MLAEARRLLARDDGQTIVEYAIVLGAISLALIIVLVGGGLMPAFQELIEDLAPFLGV